MPEEREEWPDYGYTYPRGIDLHPKSELHRDVLGKLLDNVRASYNTVSSRYSVMNEVDDLMTAYIDLSAEEKAVQAVDKNEPVSIVVPQSYVTYDTLMTYLVSVFFNDPIFRYKGVGPEDVFGAKLLEKTIEWQCRKTKVLLDLYAFWSDSIKYGRSYTIPHWLVKKGKSVKRKFRNKIGQRLNDFGVPIPAVIQEYLNEKVITSEVKFEANQLITVNPYAAFPDPNVAAGELMKRGAYFSSADRSSYYEIIEMENNYDNQYWFNGRYLSEIEGNMNSAYFSADAKGDRGNNDGTGGANKVVDTIFQVVKLIPSEWGLGGSNDPEVWEFCIAGDQVITHAEPMRHVHESLGVVDCAPEFDGRTACPVSRIEMTYGLAKIINYHFNSRWANSRMAIQNGWAFDPMVIDEEDLVNPGPGMLVRTIESMWGKGKISDHLMPLAQPDVTANNWNDIALATSLLENTTGAQEHLQGPRRRSGDRITAAEIQGDRSSALGRLMKLALLVSYQAHQDIAEIFAANTQQYMSKDVYVKSIGTWDRELAEDFGIKDSRVRVTPYDLLVDYDVYAGDLLTTGVEDLSGIERLMQMVMGSESLQMEFDVVRMARAWARMLGVRNVNDFIVKRKGGVNVMPDQEVLAGAQAGNLAPMPMEGESGG